MIQINLSDLLAQSENYKNFLEKCGWKAISLNQINGIHQYIYLWKCPNTSFTILRGYDLIKPIPLNVIEDYSKKYNTFLIKLEFRIENNTRDSVQISKDLSKNRYQHLDCPHFPSSTLIIDLTKTLNRLFSEFDQKRRNRIRSALQQHPYVKIFDSLYLSKNKHFFSRMVQQLNNNATKKGFPSSPTPWMRNLLNSFSSNCFIIVAGQDKNNISTFGFFIHSGKYLYHIYATSTDEGKQLSLPSIIVWKAIQEGKKRGCHFYDMMGIYDHRYHESTLSWKGFTRFKLGFGGKSTEFLGPYIKYPNLKFGKIYTKIVQKIMKHFYSNTFLPSIYPESFNTYEN